MGILSSKMKYHDSTAKMMSGRKICKSLFFYALLGLLETALTMTYRSPRLLLSESRVTRVEGTRLTVNCRADVEEPIQSLKWMPVRKTSTFKQEMLDNITVSLTISSLDRSDAGLYSCTLITADGEEETEQFHLLVRPKHRGGSTCRITQFKCKITKHCIFTRYRCDGKEDCGDGDGSDEDCAVDPCENKFRCNNSRCVKRHHLCDHVDDCGDNSDEQAFCNDGKVPTTEAPKDRNSLSLPKRTIFMVIASIIATVILICFIVILGCRAKMKRQRREARLMSAMNSARRLQEVPETPGSPSQAEENSGEGQPFLLNAYQPYRNGPNIIVNVNNGVQYIPQYECPMRPFMEAPPPYSEIRSSHEVGENAPPPYSTLREDQTSEWHTASQNTVNNRHETPVDVHHSSGRSARNDRRGLAHELASASDDIGGHTRQNQNSEFVNGQEDAFQNLNRDIENIGALSNTRNHFDSIGASDTRPITSECNNNIHEVSTIQSRPRSGLVQASESQFETSTAEASDDNAVSSASHRSQSMTDSRTGMTTSHGDESVHVPLSVAAIVQSSSLPLNSSINQLPSSHTNSQGPGNRLVNPLSNTLPNSPATNNTPSQADPTSANVCANQGTAHHPSSLSHDLEDASCALLQEVSRRDERNKPQPGHLSVQGGQIVLHTDSGVIAGQTVIPTNGGSGLQGPHVQGSDQPSAVTSQLGGEIVVRDGVIMLQIPVSQLILNQQNASPSALVEPARNTHDNIETSPGQVHEQEYNDGLALSPSTNPPTELAFNSESDSPTSSLPSQGGRLCGDLNIRDGQVILEPPRHTPSSQILSHLQGAYCQEESDPLLANTEERQFEPVGNTKRTPGLAGGGRHVASKCNSDVVLSRGKDYQSSL